MNREQAGKEIMNLFLRAVNKYNALEKVPVKHAAHRDLYHSERHLLDRIADNPHLNISELGKHAGVTKGAISQVVKKLEAKGLVERYKKGTSDKEVFVELTALGKRVCLERRNINDETVKPLMKELKKYSDDGVASVVEMFRWLDAFMDHSKESMKTVHRRGRRGKVQE
jgi:DNA-binding MarR family transcriptional regulator